jgi:peptidyl-tRNA hydrolase
VAAADFVLGGFAEPERAAAEALVERAAQAVESLLADGLTATMNRFNPWTAETDQGSTIERA